MPTTKDQAKDNLDQFFGKYGKEGFLQLFLTNYLQELVLLYLHSKPRAESDDTSSLLYADSTGKPYSTTQVDAFKTRLRKECGRRAAAIVKIAKDSGLLERLSEDPTSNPHILAEVEVAFRGIVEELR